MKQTNSEMRITNAVWKLMSVFLIAAMVVFGGPAALLADTVASSTASSTVASDGTEGSAAIATTNATDETASTTPASSSSTASSSTDTDGVPALIDTGNASSSVVVVGSVNTSDTNTSSSSVASTTVANESDLAATSTATSSSVSGGNSASDPDGASIFTGAANTFGALISFFNIVITNSAGQLLFLQNPLGGVDLTSQIIGAFSASQDSATGTCTLISCSNPYAFFNVITDNVADITNTLVVRSETGLNTATSTEGVANIETGTADAFGSIINFGNLQIVDSRYLVILLNNVGDLTGDIVLPTADFFASLSTSALVSGDQSFINDNTADVQNNATSTADTGSNTAQAQNQALIETGYATASTDIHNFINQNSLGGRPLCFIVSVGGKWNGKVVGLPSNFTQEETPFGKVICGAGTASNARLTSGLQTITTNYAKVLNNAIVEAVSGQNSAVGDDVIIKTGDAHSFVQILNLLNQNIVGQDWIFALFTISGDWKGDLTFGSKEFWDAINAQAAQYYGNGSGSSALRLGPANVSIEKHVSPSSIVASSTVGYAVKVKNTGDPVYHAKLIDTIYDKNHKAVHQQVWDLETVGADEEIDVSYTVVFNASSTPGEYTNEAYLDGYDQNPDIAHNLGRKLRSPVVKATLTIEGSKTVSVEPSADVCMPLLKSYIKFGEANDPADVLSLQTFLVEHEGASGISPTGLYDEPTRNALRAFQEKYASDVLTPWGLSSPSGYVYYTTQHKINELGCNGKRTFDFSPSQLEEIEKYRSSLELRRSRGEEILPEELNTVGQVPTETRVASAEETVPEVQLASEKDDALTQTAAVVRAAGSATSSIFTKIRSAIAKLFSRE